MGSCNNYQFGDHGAASCEFIIELRLLGVAPSVIYNTSVAALVLVLGLGPRARRDLHSVVG